LNSSAAVFTLTRVTVAVVAIVVVVGILAAWGLLAWQLRRGEQPVSTSWGKQLRRPTKD
jgi:predicted metal-binding membrane protein